MTTLSGPTLRVTDQTTLRDLSDFAAKAGDDSRLRGVANEDGSTTLYLTHERPSLGDRLSRRAHGQREAARLAVKEIMERHATVPTEQLRNREEIDYIETMYRSIKDDTRGMSGNKSLRGVDFRLLADTALGLYANRTGDKQTKPDQGPGLLDVVGTKAYDILARVARDIAENGTGPERVADRLAEAFSEAVADRTDRDDLKGLLAVAGERFERELTEALGDLVERYLPGQEGRQLASGEPFRGIAGSVAIGMADRVLGYTVPFEDSLATGDESYTAVRKLGEGAFGTIALYKRDGGDELVAVKTSKSEGGEQHDLLVEGKGPFAKDDPRVEYRRHLAVQGEGHDNILKLHGAFKTPEGRFGMVMEFAPHGDMEKAAGKIQEAHEGGSIDIAQRFALALTALKDMAGGLKHMHERGFVHGDVKLQNMFVGRGGVLKVADFGTAQGGGAYRLVASPRNEAAGYLSPERLKKDSLVGELGEGKTGRLVEERSRYVDQAKKTFENALSQAGIENATEFYAALEGDRIVETTAVDHNADTFALGVALHHLLTGEAFLPYKGLSGPMSTRWSVMELYASDPNNKAFGGKEGEEGRGFFGPSFGDERIDDLMNGLLHPDPGQRPTMQQVLDHPAMRMDGVGANPTRELLLRLIAG